jgi:hypothetical protein
VQAVAASDTDDDAKWSTFPILADMLRSLFVEVAVNDILTDSKSRTDSRIRLLAGVHRKKSRAAGNATGPLIHPVR